MIQDSMSVALGQPHSLDLPAFLEQEPLARHCRFRVGGLADYFASASQPEQLIAALRHARLQGWRYFVYAGGSNLFFDDAGFRGLVVQLQGGALEVDHDKLLVRVGAGYDLGLMVRELAGCDLGGLDFLANIPGSVGGAVVGNAGCYGKAVAGVLSGVTLYDSAEDRVFAAGPDYLQFSYRHSLLKNDARYVLLSATFQLEQCNGAAVLQQVEGELGERLRKHPHTAWCAGSFFKNPSSDYPAWRAISDAGMQTARVGDAMLSPMHANFLVNAGAATSAQIIELVRLVQEAVRAKLEIELMPEVRYVGPEGIIEF
jgi:UDP-N-acetylmuramate dehydrogenase